MATRVPRWTRPGHTGRGIGQHPVAVPAELAAALRALAATTGRPLAALVLACHAKVLAALTTETAVATDCATAARTARIGLDVSPGTWWDLVERLDHAVDLPEDHAVPEAALDLTALDGAEPAESAVDAAAVLTAVWLTGPDRLLLRYRADLVDETFAARVGGYYLRALELLAEHPDTPHRTGDLISAAEARIHTIDLGGPREPLTGPLFVAGFEAAVDAWPDAVAATHGPVSWTYRELDSRVNRLANALVDRGVGTEDVVAVVMDRGLDWIAAALAVFKAGGVYLPVRPDFPAERVRTQLDRSRCRHIVCADSVPAGYLAGLEREPAVLAVPDADGHPDHRPGRPLAPDQLAYIYFTSGSTGTPKGAMCEHAGMANHLRAKIDDMGVGAGDVVAQTASQCFDISLWQFAAPLLVGGSVRVVDTDTQLDVAAFVDELVGARVAVAQVVPSYFEVLLTHLERHPRDLGALRSVSITGEALKLDPVVRWFRRYPDIQLVNAYGATEVSDDTMHEVLSARPERDFVTVGRSLRNVDTYIVAEDLSLVPLGAPGEIVFAGVCVGRGYVNDPERTAAAFTSDPYRPGARLYRTGDFGRWLPEGRIEFLGRTDQQIKVNGFRIELGEIENRLTAVPGVRDSAVVVAGDGDAKALLAFYAGPDSPTPARVRDLLARSLPDYMVPSSCHRLADLPLTENGKVDKLALGRLARTLDQAGVTYQAPSTPTERVLATAWAQALDLPLERIGRAADFFAIGGTSLAAARLVVGLDRLVSLRQLVRHPVLADLAAAVDAGRAGAAASGPAGLLQPLTSAGPAVARLVCFPYAGGNAVNFQRLAKALAPAGVEVLGVELPGHDVADTDGLAEVAEVAGRVRAELAALPPAPLLLWGHCAGAAHAIALARMLESDRNSPHRLFIGALLLDTLDALAAESAEVAAMDDREITLRLLHDSSYVELDELKQERAALVGAAYRHDVCSTNRYLAQLRRDPAEHRVRTPVEVVVAADDPTTKGYRDRYRDWELLTDRVTLHELADGGHYYAGTQAARVADLVAAACADLGGRR